MERAAKLRPGRRGVNDSRGKQVSKKRAKAQSGTSPKRSERIQGGDSLDDDRERGFAASPDTRMVENPEFEAMVRRQLALLGEDPDREGLRSTPARVARSMAWLTSGYQTTVEDVVGTGIFRSEGHRNMVMVRDIELYSMCEHHMLPFFGRAHVAYLPNNKIIGLSKIPKLVEVFARRLQVQERLTVQIAQALHDKLKPKGVAVVMEARHMCMEMRGAESQLSPTTTSCMLGVFQSKDRTRKEFLELVKSKPV